MVLINEDLRAIERALGMIEAASVAVCGQSISEALVNAVEVIDGVLGDAEKRELTLGTIMCVFCDNGDHLNAKLTDKYGSQVKMSYCPICGRKLEG